MINSCSSYFSDLSFFFIYCLRQFTIYLYSRVNVSKNLHLHRLLLAVVIFAADWCQYAQKYEEIDMNQGRKEISVLFEFLHLPLSDLEFFALPKGSFCKFCAALRRRQHRSKNLLVSGTSIEAWVPCGRKGGRGSSFLTFLMRKGASMCTLEIRK